MTYAKHTNTLTHPNPLKHQTGAEVARNVIVDKDQWSADTFGRYLVAKGELLCEITATGLYGPYDRTASDGRELLTRGKTVIAAEGRDIRLGDVAIGGYYHNCVFDPSECTLHMGSQAYLATLRATFPTCEFED